MSLDNSFGGSTIQKKQLSYTVSTSKQVNRNTVDVTNSPDSELIDSIIHKYEQRKSDKRITSSVIQKEVNIQSVNLSPEPQQSFKQYQVTRATKPVIETDINISGAQRTTEFGGAQRATEFGGAQRTTEFGGRSTNNNVFGTEVQYNVIQTGNNQNQYQFVAQTPSIVQEDSNQKTIKFNQGNTLVVQNQHQVDLNLDIPKITGTRTRYTTYEDSKIPKRQKGQIDVDLFQAEYVSCQLF